MRPKKPSWPAAAPTGRSWRSCWPGCPGETCPVPASRYTPDLSRYLDALAARAHARLYSAPPYRLGAIGDLLRRDFPRALRRHARFFWLATALFLLPGVLGYVGAKSSRHLALQVLPESMAEEMEAAYANDPSAGRDEGEDAYMAGFYVRNNVGIAFRCFATGVLFGIGSIFFLVYNGLVIGTVAGLVTAAGHGQNLFTFVSGHGAFELTAIVISGAAGLLLGYTLVDTGGRTRMGALRAIAPDIARLILGAAVMLFMAAGVEAFWSPSSAPTEIKWAVAALLWVAVAAYLAMAGRTPAAIGPARTHP